jgi:aspartate dehydrogenase
VDDRADSNIDLALIGCGETGVAIAHLLSQSGLDYTLRVYDRHLSKIKTVCNLSDRHMACGSVSEVVSFAPGFLIEAASRDFIKQEGLTILERGINLVCLSSGVFSDGEFRTRIMSVARKSRAKVYLPAGPPGTDAVMVLNEYQVIGARYLSSRGMSHPTARKVGSGRYFAGSARQAIGAFSKGLNPGGVLAEAAIGYDKTLVFVDFDEQIEGYRMEVDVASNVGCLKVQLTGTLDTPSGRAPFWAAGSAVALIRKLHNPFVCGL